MPGVPFFILLPHVFQKFPIVFYLPTRVQCKTTPPPFFLCFGLPFPPQHRKNNPPEAGVKPSGNSYEIQTSPDAIHISIYLSIYINISSRIGFVSHLSSMTLTLGTRWRPKQQQIITPKASNENEPNPQRRKRTRPHGASLVGSWSATVRRAGRYPSRLSLSRWMGDGRALVMSRDVRRRRGGEGAESVPSVRRGG